MAQKSAERQQSEETKQSRWGLRGKTVWDWLQLLIVPLALVVISILFTATPDLVSEFPALAARELGMGDVPLMCATEIGVAHALPRVLRLMAHVETAKPRAEIQHVYLRGAVALRRDIAQ